MLSAMAILVAFCTACASSWKKNQASKNVVPEAMNRQVNALSKWRTLDFLGLGMGVVLVCGGIVVVYPHRMIVVVYPHRMIVT